MPALFMPTSWNNRSNVDSGSWDTRYTAGQSVILGAGSTSGFTILDAVNSFVFYRPRHVRFGTIYAGPDQWTKRTTGTAAWNVRA